MLTNLINGARTIWRRVSSAGSSASETSDSSTPPYKYSEAVEALEYFYWYQKFEELKKTSSSDAGFDEEEMMNFERYAALCRRSGPSNGASANQMEGGNEDSASETSTDSSLELGSEYEDDTMSEWSEENFEFAYDCK